MKNAVVFSGRNGLDFYALRESVVRIPEVSLRIREAQVLLDSLDLPKVDLFGSLLVDDDAFFRNIKLKSLIAAIVQVGLYDRFRKTQRQPEFLVGNSNGDSAMLVCAGELTFREMIENSQALATFKPTEKPLSLVTEPAPLLSGLSLTEYLAFRAEKGDDGQIRFARASQSAEMDLKKIVGALAQEEGVDQFVNVGPAPALRSSDYKALGSDEVECIDSIELDPMLGWFWRGLRMQDRQDMARAQ